MMHSKSVLTALFFASIGNVEAFFRINCAKVQIGRIDPIVNPGALAAHCHTIVGGANIGINATFDSLYNSQCTSCEISQDKSAYWTPNLYYQHANGSFEEVPHGGSVVYYLARGHQANNIISFPKGFQMLSGNKALRSYSSTPRTWGNSTYGSRPAQDAVSFACLGANPMPETPNLPSDPSICYNGLRAQIHFQTCWNGKDLYKADNSHVAHMSGIDNGVCPPTYPYMFPHIFMEINYAVAQLSGTEAGGRFVFSQGDPTGYGFHGDFQNAWNDEVLKEAIATCLVDGQDNSGTIDECPVLYKYSSTQYTENCPMRPRPIDEAVTGLIDKLPGCITITNGPDAATAADMDCPASSPRPSVTSTVDTVMLPTLNPQIGSSFGQNYNKVLGCGNNSYVNNGFKTLNAVYTSNPSMTVEFCQSYCTKRGYPYSGVEYGTQCYCDLAINPITAFTDVLDMRNGCNIFCPGNRSELCGGAFYINVFNNTDPNFKPTTNQAGSVIQVNVPVAPFNKTYVGCAKENSSGRALNGTSLVADDMTLQKCAGFAAANNYAYYGLENAKECWVGNGLASPSTIIDTSTSINNSNCTNRCVGNFSQICGAAGYLSVYSNPSYKPVVIVPSVGRYVSKGCLAEPTTGRALTGASTSSSSMTVDMCAKFCLGQEMKFAGVEYGSQCFCGNSLGAGAKQQACPSASSLMACPGNKYQYCGAGNLLNLYYASSL